MHAVIMSLLSDTEKKRWSEASILEKWIDVVPSRDNQWMVFVYLLRKMLVGRLLERFENKSTFGPNNSYRVVNMNPAQRARRKCNLCG